jgi:hypothetical protein
LFSKATKTKVVLGGDEDGGCSWIAMTGVIHTSAAEMRLRDERDPIGDVGRSDPTATPMSDPTAAPMSDPVRSRPLNMKLTQA